MLPALRSRGRHRASSSRLRHLNLDTSAGLTWVATSVDGPDGVSTNVGLDTSMFIDTSNDFVHVAYDDLTFGYTLKTSSTPSVMPAATGTCPPWTAEGKSVNPRRSSLTQTGTVTSYIGPRRHGRCSSISTVLRSDIIQQRFRWRFRDGVGERRSNTHGDTHELHASGCPPENRGRRPEPNVATTRQKRRCMNGNGHQIRVLGQRDGNR